LHASFNSMIETIDNLIKDVYQVRIKQREAEYEALQAKINPHFLYNTLQTISSLSLLHRNQEIETVIASLADLLEYSIYEQHEMVRVAQEVGYVKNYIDIQNYKFYHSIQYRIEIEPDVQEAYIFKFMLQPIIENAILHGLATKEGERLIVIQGCRENATVIFRIYDNGIGLSQIEMQRLITRLNTVEKNDYGKSIGLKNVYDRIRLKFGAEFGLKIDSQQGIFTCVVIEIPYIQNRR
jgi:two-component system, sensor histidine kinase YesM